MDIYLECKTWVNNKTNKNITQIKQIYYNWYAKQRAWEKKTQGKYLYTVIKEIGKANFWIQNEYQYTLIS